MPALLALGILLLTSWIDAAAPAAPALEPAAAFVDPDVESYQFYIDERNSSVGGDGAIITKQPSGSEESGSAFDGITFHSPNMLTDLYIEGKPLGSGVGVRLWLFLRFDGPANNATADFTFTLKSGSSTIADASLELEDCGNLFGGCDYEHRPIDLELDSGTSATVNEGSRLTLQVDAEAACEAGGGLPGSACSADVAWGDVDGDSRYSHLELDASVLGDSEVRIHRPGARWTDPEVLDWYPNDVVASREMQLSVDVRDAFGREDIEEVTLIIQPPQGSAVEHTFRESELRLDNNGLLGSYNWTYNPSSTPAGEYEVFLEITTLQGNPVFIEHDGFEMVRWGVALVPERDTEFIAPSQLTSSRIDLRHIGAEGDQLTVQLSLLNSLGSDWRLEFDRPAGYTLNGGGSVTAAQLTIEAPEFFSGEERRITILARASNSSGEVVQRVELDIWLEKIGVHEAPIVSMYREEDHGFGSEVANSSLDPERYRQQVVFVESEDTRSVWLDVFNTGFDDDEFRIRTKNRPDAVALAFFDNDTGQQLTSEVGGQYHRTDVLARHTAQVVRIELTGVPDRSLDDIGTLTLSITSVGNSSKQAEINVTVHRTFGIRAEVEDDDDGAPFGFVDDVRPGQPVRMRVQISDSRSDGTQLQTWRLRDPGSLDENRDVDDNYETWTYGYTTTDGTPVWSVQLSPGETVDIWLEITTEPGATAGNHTIIVRIQEESDTIAEDELRFFDMPVSLGIGADPPTLRLVQQTENRPIAPGEKRELQLELQNRGNADANAHIQIDAPDGWDVRIETRYEYVGVAPFEEADVYLLVIAPDDARHGDVAEISIRGTPFDLEDGVDDPVTATLVIELEVEVAGYVPRIMAEIVQPRVETLLGLVVVALVVVGVWWNRRGRGGEAWDDEWDDDAASMDDEDFDEDDDEFDDDESDLDRASADGMDDDAPSGGADDIDLVDDDEDAVQLA